MCCLYLEPTKLWEWCQANALAKIQSSKWPCKPGYQYVKKYRNYFLKYKTKSEEITNLSLRFGRKRRGYQRWRRGLSQCWPSECLTYDYEGWVLGRFSGKINQLPNPCVWRSHFFENHLNESLGSWLLLARGNLGHWHVCPVRQLTFIKEYELRNNSICSFSELNAVCILILT